MSLVDDAPVSSPGPETSLQESLKYYKKQYELLEAELAEFQSSSKDLEAELEKDIEASEKRERQFKDKAANLQYEVDEWKTKYRESKSEASSAQNRLQKEITDLRDKNRGLQMRLRDIEVANDDYERKQRNTESSLEDMESKYNQGIERCVMLEEEMRSSEQEREALRIESQRLKDELSDLKIEADITKEKLQKAEALAERSSKSLVLDSVPVGRSPRSELSPTTTNTSSQSFDTPPAKTASSSGLSETRTPPSPSASEKSTNFSKPFATPSIPKTRMSINANTTPRPVVHTTRPNGHVRGPSIPAISRTGPASSFRQSLSRAGIVNQRSGGLPQSSSIMQLRNLRGKMQKLEERVHTARSKLPGPVNTPPRASPRSGSALGHHNNIPASVTVRSRRRNGGSTISGEDSLPEPLDAQNTPSVRSRASRQSIQLPPPATPSRGGDMAAPPPRPSSRASVTSSRASASVYLPSHSRPGSRASISNHRAILGGGVGSSFAPNASTDRVRPQSSLSTHGSHHGGGGYDGTFDEDSEIHTDTTTEARPSSRHQHQHHTQPIITTDLTTPTARRTTFNKRISDVSSTIPLPATTTKRTSIGGNGLSKLPGPSTSTRRQSSNFMIGRNSNPEVSRNNDMRPPSRLVESRSGQSYDLNETF